MNCASADTPTRQADGGYVGRFAPSPTGPLHLGSLVAALGSWLDARSRGGRWLVRIEDIDFARNVAGASGAILRELERCQLTWDGAVEYQSARNVEHRAAVSRLVAEGQAFPCACSRREVAGRPYPGTCRNDLPSGRSARSVRMRVSSERLVVADAIQGDYAQNLAEEVGDFVVLRADDVVAYHLAVVMDDAQSGVTDVVRGADLLDSTPRQLWLYRALGLQAPRYAHLPVVTNTRGQKLSKQTHAPPLHASRASIALWSALEFLGQAPPGDLVSEAAATVVAWGLENWCRRRVPRTARLA